MKICFFTENYYKGGLDTFLINLFNAWPDQDDELTLTCNSSHLGLATIAEKTRRPIKIETYSRMFTSAFATGHSDMTWSRLPPIRAFFVLTFRLVQYPILFPWYVFTLRLFFKHSNFDRLMVVNGGYPASLLGRSAVIAWWLAGKRPLAVMNFHSTAQPSSWYNYIIERLIDKLILITSEEIVSVSNSSLNSLTSRKISLNKKKFHYIYNGIEDPRSYYETKLRKNTPHERYCLMLATYHQYKGHFYLLKAFQEVVRHFPDVQLQIYGHGRAHEKKRVVDEVKRLNLEKNVVLGEFIPNTAKLLANASVLVVPSQAYESFGLTIIEAMAFGVPVVATDVGGIPEVIGESNCGYVCSKDNPLDFSNAINKVLGDQALAYKLGQNGRLAFESNFTADTMCKGYKQLLE